MKTWLITGGAGFIGSNFVLAQSKRGEVRMINLDLLTYAGNPLVNVFCLGIAPKERIFLARAGGEGNPVIYVGAKTGRDGKSLYKYYPKKRICRPHLFYMS